MGHLQLKLSCLMCVYVCVCACMCKDVHMCGGHSPTTHTPIHPTSPTPRAAGSPKHQNSISLELIKIFRFCLKILYLGTLLDSYRLQLVPLNTPPPPPRAKETQIRNITISIEWIKIIQFCLKIWDPWTPLHTYRYRLGLMCRWGCPIPNDTFMFWNQKSTSFLLLWPSNKNFSCFCIGSH